MSLRIKLGLPASFDEGTPEEVADKQRRALIEAVRPERVAVARRMSKWTEIESDLVPRGRSWLVSASTDAVYVRHPGVVFQPYSVNVIADRVELSFYVDEDGELVFLDRLGFTWSEHVERRERRRLARR